MRPTQRIRVAFCLDSFGIGGTELNAVRTAEALDFNRFELYVMYLQNRGPLRARYEDLGVHMAHFPISNLYSPRTAVQGFYLARLLRRWGIDVVHAHDIYTNIFAVPWARLLGGCAVIASRRWWYEAPRPELVTLNRWVYSLAHRVLCNSSGVVKLLSDEEGVAPDKIIEIPNFLGETAFESVDQASRIAQRRAWGLPDNVLVIGMVARLAPVKNHALLLRAAVQLGLFHIVLVGDGPSRAELEHLAQQLGIASRVHFTGEVISPLNLHQFFDVSVLCSTSEGFPNSLIEAMAAARPVIATPVGGVTDVVEDDVTGMIVPVDDEAPLVRALRMLEADPQLRTRLGEAGREAVRTKFSQEIVIEKLAALYEKLAARPSVAAGRFVDD
jgi:glycosyltransferase involved in cell wall biosynthesis